MKTKQNKSLSKFVDFKRFTFVIPIILLAFAMLVFGIWGVNRGLDYKDSYTFDVYFNTSVDKAQYKEYTKIIKDTFNEQSDGDFTVVITKLNEDIASGCKVNVLTSDKEMSNTTFSDRITTINTVVKEKLDAKNESRSVRFTDLQFQSAESYSKPFAMGLIALAVVMALMFVYFWIRFELKMALSSLIVGPYSAITTLSLMILFRIPFTYNFMLPVLVSSVLAYILYFVIFAYVKSKLIEKSNMTNADVIYDSIAHNKSVFLVLLALAGALVVLMLTLNLTHITLLIALMFAIVSALYSGIILPTTMWCEIYKKDKDNRLKARIELLAKRENEKEQKSANTEENTK